jgi:hypothetical protein
MGGARRRRGCGRLCGRGGATAVKQRSGDEFGGWDARGNGSQGGAGMRRCGLRQRARDGAATAGAAARGGERRNDSSGRRRQAGAGVGGESAGGRSSATGGAAVRRRASAGAAACATELGFDRTQ